MTSCSDGIKFQYRQNILDFSSPVQYRFISGAFIVPKDYMKIAPVII